MVALFPGKIPTGMEYDFLIKESFLFVIVYYILSLLQSLEHYLQ